MNSKEILESYDAHLEKATKKLKTLEFYCGNEVKQQSISGWVLEQTVQHFLKKELTERGYKNLIFEEEQTIMHPNPRIKRKHIRVDLTIKNPTSNKTILIEIKKGGIYGEKQLDKYMPYIKKLKTDTLYLYLTLGESVKKYREKSYEVFRKENVFILKDHVDEPWERFVNIIEGHIK